MLNHGLSTGALFLAVGMLYERAHTRHIKDFGGVAKRMPVFAGFFLVAVLSSAGLPGLNGFIGEITCLYGVFAANKIYAAIAVTTIILGAAYLLWMYQRVMHGPITNEKVKSFPDMSLREIVCFVPIVVLMFWMGIAPQTFLGKMTASAEAYIQRIKGREKIFVQAPAPAPAGAKMVLEERLPR
jgi:NADH-quinone oxidoreductase subunit M